jgi:hypothetical protein
MAGQRSIAASPAPKTRISIVSVLPGAVKSQEALLVD